MEKLTNVTGMELAIATLNDFGEQITIKENGNLFEERLGSGELKPISEEAVLTLRKEIEKEFKELKMLAGGISEELLRDTFAYRRQLRKAAEDMLDGARDAEIRYFDNDVRVVVKETGCADEEYPINRPHDLLYVSTMICDGTTDDSVADFVKRNEGEFWNLRERWLTHLDSVKDAPSELKAMARPFIGKELNMSY